MLSVSWSQFDNLKFLIDSGIKDLSYRRMPVKNTIEYKGYVRVNSHSVKGNGYSLKAL